MSFAQRRLRFVDKFEGPSATHDLPFRLIATDEDGVPYREVLPAALTVPGLERGTSTTCSTAGGPR
jgi:hypothetical protein